MTFDFTAWPDWVVRTLWTAGTIAGAWLIGHILNATVVARLGSWAGRTSRSWDEAVVAELKRRVPLWSLLVGAYASQAHWNLAAEHARLLSHGLFVIGAASATFFAAAVVSRLLAEYGRDAASPLPVSSLTHTIARILVIGLGALVILNGLGVSITPMLTALGVGGLAVALALQEPLGNLFAGITTTAAGQLRVGDYVKLDSGIEGYIADFGWRSTRIRMLAGNLVLVPNSKLSQAVVTNFHLPANDLAVLVDVGVAYASDLAQVERVTTEVAESVMRDVKGGVPEFSPFVRFHTFADSSINFSVIMRAREFVDQFLVKHEFVKRLHIRYAAEGIVIPFPQRVVTSRSTTPPVSA
jgi:small-conductance mechanosensitive channel